jgi:hypothetical protein
LGQHELSQLEKIMSRLDINSDGYIDLSEFSVAVSEMETMRWRTGIVVVVAVDVVCVCTGGWVRLLRAFGYPWR